MGIKIAATIKTTIAISCRLPESDKQIQALPIKQMGTKIEALSGISAPTAAARSNEAANKSIIPKSFTIQFIIFLILTHKR